jgi:hypothetical protein
VRVFSSVDSDGRPLQTADTHYGYDIKTESGSGSFQGYSDCNTLVGFGNGESSIEGIMADTQATSSVNVLLPIATLVIGLIAKPITDWFDSRRIRDREREARQENRLDQMFERRNTFQRQTLLELQGALLELVRTTSSINHVDVMASRKAGHWQKGLVPDDLNEEHRLANAQTTVLSVRVRDQAVRDLVDEVKQNGVGTLFASSEPASTQLLKQMSDTFDKLNARIGELLREMDDAFG